MSVYPQTKCPYRYKQNLCISTNKMSVHTQTKCPYIHKQNVRISTNKMSVHPQTKWPLFHKQNGRISTNKMAAYPQTKWPHIQNVWTDCLFVRIEWTGGRNVSLTNIPNQIGRRRIVFFWRFRFYTPLKEYFSQFQQIFRRIMTIL